MVQEAWAGGAEVLRDDEAPATVRGSAPGERSARGGPERDQPIQQRADGAARGAQAAQGGKEKPPEGGWCSLFNVHLHFIYCFIFRSFFSYLLISHFLYLFSINQYINL